MFLKYSNGNKKYDFTDVVSTITWSGSREQAARSLSFDVLNDPLDPGVDKINIRAGDRVSMYDDNNNLVFIGNATNHKSKSEVGTKEYRAIDDLNFLLRNKGTFKFKNTTAEYIAKFICHQCGIPAGSIKKTSYRIKKMIFVEKEHYNVILAAYTKAKKYTGKKYFLKMNGTKLEVVELGTLVSDFILREDERIISSEYEESTDEVVNKVNIYDSKNKKIGTLKRASSIKKYGTYSDAVTVEKGKGTAEAKALLHDTTKTATLEAIGDIRCISGKAIMIKDSATGLIGKYYISHDEHTFQGGVHQMSLDLEFSNIMETVKDDTESSSASTSTSSGTASGKAEAVVKYAKSFQGKVRYVFGASTPQKGKSDCSGYTQYVYRKAVGIDIGRTADVQYEKGKKVSKGKLKLGDLVFFKDTYKTRTPHCASHVGIMVSNKKFINCHSSGVDICSLNQSYWAAHYLGGKRVV